MALPNPSMSFSPFAILTAEEMNNLVENIEALADGSGLNTGAVGPSKRSGGFKIGTISGSTLGTTGNKNITGVGFTPKLVRFTVLGTSSTSVAFASTGAMTSSNQYYAATASSSGGYARVSSTSACIAVVTAGSTTLNLSAAYVSMNADGFTINVTAAFGTFDVAYEAYG